MVVPYGDPSPVRSWQNYFDTGEYQVGQYANSLELGCDCLGDITYLSPVIADGFGNPREIRNGICMHEEDSGILAKHSDLWTGINYTRRNRRMVISFFTTIGNYDYGFYWYLYLDGTIELESKATGVLFPSAFRGDEAWKQYTTVRAMYEAAGFDVAHAASCGLPRNQRAITAAEPAAFLVPPRLLRRVIRAMGARSFVGLSVPHRQCLAIGGAAALRIIDPEELGLHPSTHELPKVPRSPGITAEDTLAEATEEGGGGGDVAALSLEGLDHDRGDFSWFHQQRERLVELREAPCDLFLFGEAAEEGRGEVDVRHRGQCTVIAGAVAGGRGRQARHGEGAAVEGALEGDESGATGGPHGELDSGLECFGPAVREEDLAIAADQFDELLGEVEVWRAEGDVMADVHQRVHLRVSRLQNVRVVVPDVGDRDATGEVEELATIIRPQSHTLRTLDHQIGSAAGCRRKQSRCPFLPGARRRRR